MRIGSQFLGLAAGCGVFFGVGTAGRRRAGLDLLQHSGSILGVLVCPFSPVHVCSLTPTLPHPPPPGVTMLSLFLPGDVDQKISRNLYPIYLVLGGVGILAFLGVGMVAARKRRHEHGRLWLPEGFKTTETSKKKRREPVGEDSVGLK